MDFPKEYLQVVKEIEKFAVRELREPALEWDLNPDPKHLLAFWEKSRSLDLPFIPVPERFQGVGYGPLCQAMAVEALARQCPGAASVFVHHFAGLFPVQFAEEGRQSELWRGVTNGQGGGIAGVVLDGEHALTLTMKNNDWVINGRSSLTANVSYAGWMCVFTKANNQENLCLIVPLDAPGVSLGPDSELPGLKINPFRSLVFKDVKLPPDAVIKISETSQSIKSQTRDLLHAFIAAAALGAARTAFEKALAYAKERYQYGKIIIQHQEIRRMLGAMRMNLDAARAFLYAYFDEKSGVHAAHVKAFCTDAAFNIVVDAIQIHGGYGYMHEQGLEKLMRDVKVLQVLGGSNPQLLVDSIKG
ncbi:Acyl-CoA dehydrogenase [Desulfatibacillum alkenivorans DSM 16219]|jgi:alkylation response protein AidB-like acyl-CoA dehydrogenase|uniref:Acyl-CoA dehydrogenase n=1 Tax=Desulfatibacillum alkenivorans DSM 16219 TaxID=1121393 RepID=A0A1M6VR84_9BACT|nr:acyl-CoA dehydrogenase family protein [Desulfatibacillum alkenivorans]SHK84013.1 Acyl-CoA dehydrogenase [Desulfatibacillum alkenivorans DSM 16219]